MTTDTTVQRRSALAQAKAERDDVGKRLRALAAKAETEQGGEFTDEQVEEAATLKGRFQTLDADVDRMTAAQATYQAMKSLNTDDEQPTDRTPPLSKAIARGFRAWASSGKALNPSGGSLTVPLHLGIFGQPIAGPSLLALPRQRVLTGTDSFKYLRQTPRAANAAHAVGRGDVKPTQEVGIEPVEDRARVYAVLSEPVYQPDLADVSGLEQWLTNELVRVVQERVERDIILGDDENPTPEESDEFDGIANTAGVLALAEGDDPFTRVRRTLAVFQNTGIVPNAVVVNPLDYAEWELTKDADGRYIMSGLPNQVGPRGLFGVTVAASAAIPQGAVALGDWRTATELVTRETIRVDWSNSVADDFQRNMIRFRVEGRFGFGVQVPAALAYGTLTGETEPPEGA